MKVIKILVAEHNPFDVELLDYELSKSELQYLTLVVSTALEYMDALKTFVPDIILSDYTFPSFDGSEAFRLKDEFAPLTPFIFVTGTVGEEVAVAFIKDGVTDYVLKDKLFTLHPKIKRALKEAAASRLSRLAEEQQKFDSSNMNALINNTNDLMWSIDRDFKLITSNIPFDRMVGSNIGRALKKGESVLSASYTPEMVGHFTQLYNRVFDGEIFSETEHFTTPVESWTEISYYPIHNGDLIIGAACHAREITEIKFAELQINNNEKRYRALVENGADAVIILTSEAIPIYISPTVVNVIGYSETEALHMNYHVLMHPKDIECITKVWNKTMTLPGVPVTISPNRLKHKDGSWRWLEGTLTNLLKDPAVEGIVVNFRDVTKRKQTEDALQLTQFAVDNAADAIYWMTPDGSIINVNQAACDMLDYDRTMMLGFNITDINKSSSNARLRSHFQDLRNKGAVIFETVHQANDGTAIPVEIRANYITFGDLELNCAFVRDISERKKAESEREKLTDSLIQRNRDLEQFTFIISHNLRAPIANIIGCADNLLNEALTPDEHITLLQGLSVSVAQMDTTIRDINAILQLKLDLNEKKEMVSFSGLMVELHDTVESLRVDRQVEIRFDFSEADEIFTLKVYLYSIFYNLIDNSIKYGNPDGLTVIEIQSRKENDTVTLTFKDNGLGIDLLTKGDKIFGLYNRFHTYIEGKGMGLFMVKTQVEAIGGTITVASELGQGTEFTITW